jgi:hypothetical protein
MSNERASAIRRVSAAIAAATIIVPVAGCGSDSDGAATQGAAGASSSTADATLVTAEFPNLRDDAGVTTSEYVGAIDGTDIYAAFAFTRETDGGASHGGIAYFCDGKMVANWFRLVGFDGDQLTFQNTAGSSFTATLRDDGSVQADAVPLGGTDYAVTADMVDPDGEFGLYLADYVIDPDLSTDERGGWILLPDGSQRGAIRATSTNTVLPGTTLNANVGVVAVAGRDILLRAITHIISMDAHS